MIKESEILVFGDVMLDHYIYGDVTRISPEAPIPVVLRKKDEYILGGAANVAANLKNLGVKVQLMGLIGNDSNGDKLEKRIEALGISSFIIRDDSFVTTCKSRVVAQNHQMLRVDTECRPTLSEKHLSLIKQQIDAFTGKIIIISDYDKGICTSDICQWIIKQANKREIKVLVDPKEKNWEKFKGSYLIKPDLKELDKVLQLDRKEYFSQNLNNPLFKLMEDLNVVSILLTKGGEGMSLFYSNKIYEIKPHQVDVYDVTGAGDTVIAVLSFELFQGKTIREACNRANDAAAFVITKKNTYAISLEDLN